MSNNDPCSIINGIYDIREHELTLTLFVFWIFTDYSDRSFSFDDLAFFAHGLHGRSYFHVDKPPLLSTPGNSAAGQVIGRHLHCDLVTGQNPDEIHSELSGNMR